DRLRRGLVRVPMALQSSAGIVMDERGAGTENPQHMLVRVHAAEVGRDARDQARGELIRRTDVVVVPKWRALGSDPIPHRTHSLGPRAGQPHEQVDQVYSPALHDGVLGDILAPTVGHLFQTTIEIIAVDGVNLAELTLLYRLLEPAIQR